MVLSMARKKCEKPDFRDRLVALRKARGLTQTQLANKIGSNQRVISHYETRGANPPLTVVADLAHALRVSTDELIGTKPLKTNRRDGEERRLWKKFQKVKDLPVKDQRAIIRMVNSLAQTSGK